MLAFLFHPGDLSNWELAGILGVFFAMFVLPLLVIGIIIHKVISEHTSRVSEGDHITLGLSDIEKSAEE